MGRSLEAAIQEIRKLQSKDSEPQGNDKCRISQVYLTLEKNMSKKSKSAHKPCLEPLSNSVLTHGALRSSSPLDFLNTRLRWLADRKKGIEKLKT